MRATEQTVTWERALSHDGPWVRVKLIPSMVFRRYQRRLARGETYLVIAARRYYYRPILGETK